MSKWQTLQISGETVPYELSHLDLHCLQKPLIAFGSERVITSLVKDNKLFILQFDCATSEIYPKKVLQFVGNRHSGHITRKPTYVCKICLINAHFESKDSCKHDYIYFEYKVVLTFISIPIIL